MESGQGASGDPEGAESRDGSEPAEAAEDLDGSPGQPGILNQQGYSLRTVSRY